MALNFIKVEFILFFVVFLAFYWLSNNHVRVQNILLLSGSILFYGFGSPVFLLIIACTILANYTLMHLMNRNKGKKEKIFLIITIGINILTLGIFKYFNFFYVEIQNFLLIFGLKITGFSLNLVLPLGMSFYMFSLISYNIDLFQGKILHEPDLISFSTYVLYFPKIIAGPIERAVNFIPKLREKKKMDSAKVIKAIDLLLIGYFLKLTIADFLDDKVQGFFLNPGSQSPADSLIYVWLYVIQIYADFAGYSSMACGFSLLLGIEIMNNFNQPYLSRSFREFWGRWHVSLSTWLRDYLYIPLGGNRKGKARTYLNLLITMVIAGLWHGAGITFVIWGFVFGILLILNHIWVDILNHFKPHDMSRVLEYQKHVEGSTIISRTQKRSGKKAKIIGILKNAIAWFVVINTISILWIFFRAPTLAIAIIIIKKIVYLMVLFISAPASCIVNAGLVGVLLFTGFSTFIIDYLQNRYQKHEIFCQFHWIIRGICYAIIFFLLISVHNQTFPPFIYQGF